jgi:YHS domain-containing protein
MSKIEFTIHCPVCHMKKINRALLFKFQGVDHHFCSTQCLQRFKAHPHLFVGDPKHGMSPKQKGQVVIKRRRIGFTKPAEDELKAILKRSLLSLMGIEELVFEEQCLYVTYDLLQISLEEIEETLERLAATLDAGLVNRIRHGFIHYSEECELDNLAHLTRDDGCH